jgi:large repetitive protein
MAPGQQGIDYDFGEILPAQAFISGSVYRDDDRDGLRDGGEPAISAVTLTLYDSGADGVFGNADDGPTLTTTTDGVGNYLFANLPTGHNYQVVETQPAAYGNSPAGPTVLIAVNNLPATGSINNNYGEILGSLAGAVYFDANNNGTRDAGEPGIAGTTVALTGTDVNGAALNLTATTAADGSYRFSNLATGNYVVTETQPAVYADGAETIGSVGGINSANDLISAIPLGAGVDATNYNFGERGVPVSGVVFYDENRDGTVNAGEVVRLPGVTIQLVNSSGVIVATTTTQPDGSYVFANVPPGSYTIIEIQPVGYGDPLTGPFAPDSRPITVANTAVTNQNFADTLSILAGNVYVDTSNDGIRQGGETGIGGVPVRLDWAGPDSIFGNGDDVTGFVSTITGTDGSYRFSDLRTGVYRVVEPAQPTPYNDGIDTAGSAGGDVSTNEQITDIPIAAGVDLTNYNFGELAPAQPFISGSVYIDTNNNGTRDPGEPGIPGVIVTLTGSVGPLTIITDPNGNYVFPNLIAGGNYTITETQPAAYGNGLENTGNSIAVNNLPAAGSTNNNFGELPGTISGVVYFDSDSSGTLNGGDLLIAGVTVTLQDATGAAINNPITGQPYVFTTQADGSYLFANLPGGNYRVVETQPTGYNDGAETPGIGNTSAVNDQIDVTLAAAGNSPDNNFGELGTNLSGSVWIDTDRDGTIDGTETGRLGNVLITLVDSTGSVVATTTTSALDGSYSFGNVLPGNYTIIQTQPSAYGSSTPNSLPLNLPLTGLTNQNFGETLGSLAGTVYADVNRNGIPTVGEPGISGITITLTGTDVNGNPVNLTDTTDANGNYSFTDLPAGDYTITETQPTAYNDGQEQAGTAGGNITTNDVISSIPLGAGVNATGYDFGEISATISGTVWLDRDRSGGFDSGEPGVPGVTIELRDTLGNLIATTTTGADGSYSFVGLPGGSYVIVELQPNGYGSSTANSIPVTVPNSGRVTDQNFGETLGSISGSVYIDTDDDGARDAGETGIPNTIITLTGTDVNGNQVNLTTTTDSNGNYSFGDLVAGNYTITETQPLNHGDGRDASGNAGGTISNDQVSGIALTAGSDAAGYDFGENPLSPTAVVLVSFTATHTEGGVMVRWETSAELDTWGFQLYRSTTGNRADAVLVTPEQIAATGRGQGASYEWMDTTAEVGVTYSYWLVETELGGATHAYGPVRTAVGTPTDGMYTVALPLVIR